MTITEGLFQLDMIDHHAVLGFSLAEDAKQVRKRYLKVARQLHPDSLREASDAQRKLASELLSKQVNPAYEVLSQDKSMKEHKILLKMKQKQLNANPSLVSLTSESARALLDAKDVDASYRESLKALAAAQFTDLSQVEAIIGEVSELNAAYLIRQQTSEASSIAGAAAGLSTSADSPSIRPPAAASPTPVSAPSKAATPARSHRSAIIQSYLKRAQEFESQQDYSRGILEMREAIASHPKNAACHAYLSSLYLKSGQSTLAKIHAKQALVFEPENETALTVRSKLSAQTEKAIGPKKGQKKGQKKAANSEKAAKNQKGNKKGGGLLSGLFGGNKR